MAKSQTAQVKGNKHSSGVRGIAEAINILRQFEIVQNAKAGSIVEQGGSCDAFRLKPRSNDQNNNVITVVFARTDGCQEVWITFKPSPSGLDEKVRILGNLLRQKYPKFKLKDFPEFKEVQTPKTPAVSTVKIPLLQASVLEPITTPVVLPVEIVKGDDMTESHVMEEISKSTTDKVVELTQAQADAYHAFKTSSKRRDDGKLYFEGKSHDVSKNYTSVIYTLKKAGCIERFRKGKGWGDLLVNEVQVKIIPSSVKRPSQLTPVAKISPILTEKMFREPEMLKIFLLRLLVRNEEKLRDADDLSAALLAVEEVKKVLEQVSQHREVLKDLLSLFQV